jgi:phosphoinositide-3-kinase regulatory subunit 4
MGSTLSTQSVQLESCLHDLPGITYEASLGKSRFLKTLRCIHDEGTVLVKVYIKPSSGGTLEKYAEKLKEIRNAVSIFHHPNILPFQIFMETEKAGFMIRQYFYNNLHDRISTRPFLTPVEKKWITYQLLSAVERLHFYGQCHGDIKLENFLLTSWNWVYLSDFACCKPTYIPEDNPVDFSYFFDSSGRRVCYIAPERFIASGKKPNEQQDLDPLMDVFSVGCAIAEFWLDGVPVFNYSEAVSFRKKEYDPSQKINRIEDLNVRNLVMSMIQYERDQRVDCSQVIKDWYRAYYN